MKCLLPVLTLCLAGCKPEPDTPLISTKTVPPRISVTRIAVFPDDIAYEGRRGIYLIKDAETGKEFFGVSGVGISELGSHSSGKTHFEDER